MMSDEWTASAVGKVLPAHADEDVFTKVVGDGFVGYTRETVTDPAEPRLALAECRRTGVAVVREEMSPGAYSVAARITDSKNRVVTALSVVGADAATRLLVPAVVMAGRGISRGLKSAAIP